MVPKKRLLLKLKSMARKSKGKLIVFEGIDGSGKTTISNLLINFLKRLKIAYSHYSFPRYSEAWGMMVRRYLDGEFGDVDQVDPYLASVLYAGDRFAAANQIRKDLEMDKIVVCDRYMASNIAHQAAKLQTPNSKLQFIKWLEKFEYTDNKIPREDLVILLSMPSTTSQKLMDARKLDIHEKDAGYLAEVGKVYEQLAKEKENWERVESVESGRLLKPAEVFEKVLVILTKHNILRTL